MGMEVGPLRSPLCEMGETNAAETCRSNEELRFIEIRISIG